MKLYVRAAVRYFIFFTLSAFLFLVINMIIGDIYSLTSLYYPDIFPRYDEITTPKEYERLILVLGLISGILALPLTVYITVAFDNERFEYIISKTDGFYRIADGAGLYIPRYIIPDVISSILAPIPIFLLTFIKEPLKVAPIIKRLFAIRNSLTSLICAFTELFGAPLGIILLILIPIVLKLLFSFPALVRWRGMWLSNINNI